LSELRIEPHRKAHIRHQFADRQIRPELAVPCRFVLRRKSTRRRLRGARIVLRPLPLTYSTPD